MTTHVFIVDETTFQYHLQYLFAATGAGEKDVDFNNTPFSKLYPWKKHAAESGLVAMMADCCRVRKGDLIIFYLQAKGANEGKFYGIFEADSDAFLDRNDGNQFLKSKLQKSLTFRIKIKPYQVFAEGVTEWEALDEIKNIPCPYQMLWSRIYRKLKGNRGNTMITIYEAERLIDLLRRKNNNKHLKAAPGYQYAKNKIDIDGGSYPYVGRMIPLNILPRLYNKFQNNKAHEAHLQMYIVQNVLNDKSLRDALGISACEWIGNEVSCGVGMRRIDVMLSIAESTAQRILMPIELKAVPASSDNIRQINRYIDWIEQYYIPNRPSTIRPVLICRPGGLSSNMKAEFKSFNAAASGRYLRYLPLIYIEYTVNSARQILFTRIQY